VLTRLSSVHGSGPRQLRKWDEAAKEVHMDMPGLDHYRPMMLKHLLAQRAGA